jgi:hypothetical protein
VISAAIAKRLDAIEREVAKIAPPAPPEWVRWVTDSELSEAQDLFDREGAERIGDLSAPAQLRCWSIYAAAIARMLDGEAQPSIDLASTGSARP